MSVTLSPSRFDIAAGSPSSYDAPIGTSRLGYATTCPHQSEVFLSDFNPQALLRSAAKSFQGTPSILRKRPHEVVTPSQECATSKKGNAVQEVHTPEKNCRLRSSRTSSNSSSSPDSEFANIWNKKCLNASAGLLICRHWDIVVEYHIIYNFSSAFEGRSLVCSMILLEPCSLDLQPKALLMALKGRYSGLLCSKQKSWCWWV